MDKKGQIRRMFPGGNTTAGFVSWFQYMIRPDANRIFILKGGPGTGKSTFMMAIGQDLMDRGMDVEYHHCSTDPDSLDGLVIPALKVALMDGTAPHINDPKNPGAVDEIISLGEYWEEKEIIRHRDEIVSTNQKVSRLFQIAFSLLRQSRAAYEEWESYVQETVNRAEACRILRSLRERVLGAGTAPNQSAPKSRHLFGSAITPKGVVDFRETLLRESSRIFFIKGQPGTGVRQMIAGIARSAEELGFFTEQYHCPYEPEENKLDMLLIPDIQTAVVNNSPPCPFGLGNPVGIRPVAEIDLDDCMQKGRQEEYEPERADAEIRSRDLLQKAVDHLARAKSAHDEIEGFYIQSMDYDRVRQKRDEVLHKILQYQ